MLNENISTNYSGYWSTIKSIWIFDVYFILLLVLSNNFLGIIEILSVSDDSRHFYDTFCIKLFAFMQDYWNGKHSNIPIIRNINYNIFVIKTKDFYIFVFCILLHVFVEIYYFKIKDTIKVRRLNHQWNTNMKMSKCYTFWQKYFLCLDFLTSRHLSFEVPYGVVGSSNFCISCWL